MHTLIDTGPFQPCPAPFNMAAYVLEAGLRTPDKTALQIVGLTTVEHWSYAELTRAVRGIGTGLLRAGLKQGDRVLLRLGNTVDFPLAYLGALAVGLVPIPTSSQLTRAEITGMAAQITPAAIIAASGVACPEHPAPVIDENTLRNWHDLPACDWQMGDPDRLGYMIFTSGTSASPRVVKHAHRAVWARRMMWADWVGLCPQDRLLHAGAFNWTYTIGTGLMDPWAIGATALIPAEGIAPMQLPLLLRRYEATIFAAAPGVYRQMLKSPILALPNLRHGLSAGEKLPDVTRQAWMDATKTPIYEALGMSEVSTFISTGPNHPTNSGISGYAQTGRRIAVLSPEGTPTKRGEAGILAVSDTDPGLFLGYDNADDDTASRFCNGWFLTGDTVTMEDDGAIRYLGRQDDMMNAGGYRVSPLEVEHAFGMLDGILDSAAVELPLKTGVNVIGLFYVSPNGALPEPVLEAHAQATLARYKQPRLYVHRQTLPKGANNKLNRRALRTEWKDHNDHQT